MMRKITKQILQGVGAEQWLPFAKAKLATLNATAGGSFIQQAYRIEDAVIRISKGPDIDWIRIDIDRSPRYEFFTPEHIDSDTLASPGYPGFVAGSGLRATLPTATKPLFSSVNIPADHSLWEYVNATQAATAKPTFFQTWAAWQDQKFAEHLHWPNNGSSSLVSSAAGLARGKGNQSGWLDYHHFNGPANNGFTTDVGLDVPPAYYAAAGAQVGAPALESTVWWRHAAVQTAGGRQFFILTDTHGRFHVYPVKPYQTINPLTFKSLPAVSFKTFTPPYPAWATLPDTAAENRYGQWLWSFNKDGTKAASIAFNSAYPGTFYKHRDDFRAYISPGMLANTDIPDTGSAVAVPGRKDTPGLVEFGIAITVTGTGDMDFSVAFTLLQSDYFANSGRFYFDAAYLLKDSRLGAAEDALVTAEIEAYFPSGTPIAADYTLLDVDHVTSYYVVKAHSTSAGTTSTGDQLWSTGGPDSALVRELLGYDQHFKFPAWADMVLTAPLDNGLGGTANYPIIPLQVPARTTVQPGTPSGQPYGYINASELRTLSRQYEYGDHATGNAQSYIKAFNTTFKAPRLLGWTIEQPIPSLPAGLVPVPAAGADIYQSIINLSIKPMPGAQFDIHPTGHWSFTRGGSAAGQAYYDIVAAKGKPVTNHKALYNKAFGQNRDYSFYNYTSGTAYDIGNFRSQGVWMTF